MNCFICSPAVINRYYATRKISGPSPLAWTASTRPLGDREVARVDYDAKRLSDVRGAASDRRPFAPVCKPPMLGCQFSAKMVLPQC